MLPSSKWSTRGAFPPYEKMADNPHISIHTYKDKDDHNRSLSGLFILIRVPLVEGRQSMLSPKRRHQKTIFRKHVQSRKSQQETPVSLTLPLCNIVQVGSLQKIFRRPRSFLHNGSGLKEIFD